MFSGLLKKELTKKHTRTTFDCGESTLNDYLKKFALQNAKNNVSKTFVVVSPNTLENILGFYSLSAANIDVESLPLDIRKKLPRYPIPMARLTRLAVDKSMQGQKLGEFLLIDSLQRCVKLAKEMGIFGVLVDAKHEKAKHFYQKYGFREIINQPLTLFLPIKTIIASL
ncbi:GCN5-related N-acetyltransferase [Beggiatoa sp. PS]|nr:GCN5-related N-acetyltransferase [Beggiatoa sp. PS]